MQASAAWPLIWKPLQEWLWTTTEYIRQLLFLTPELFKLSLTCVFMYVTPVLSVYSMFGHSWGNGQWQWVLFVLVLWCWGNPAGPSTVPSASLALPSQQNDKHASQAKSPCHVVNGLGYPSWRPAEAPRSQGRNNKHNSPLEVGCGGRIVE